VDAPAANRERDRLHRYVILVLVTESVDLNRGTGVGLSGW
jgi:hypothetical protein